MITATTSATNPIAQDETISLFKPTKPRPLKRPRQLIVNLPSVWRIYQEISGEILWKSTVVIDYKNGSCSINHYSFPCGSIDTAEN